VPSKKVREVLLFRIQNLRACKLGEMAACLEKDLREICLEEVFVVMNDKEKSIERIERMREIRGHDA
jgi:hypothetical protein